MPFDELLESDVIAADRANIFHIDWLLKPLLTGDWPKVRLVKEVKLSKKLVGASITKQQIMFCSGNERCGR